MRVVIDANVLVSAIIRPQGGAAQVLSHLRVLHPFRGIPIVVPADFLTHL